MTIGQLKNMLNKCEDDTTIIKVTSLPREFGKDILGLHARIEDRVANDRFGKVLNYYLLFED